jgi:hypothetical protein
MPVAVNINSVEASGGNITLTGFLVLSGTYPTGGDTVNLAAPSVDPSFVGQVPYSPSSVVLNFDVWSGGGANINGANSVAYGAVLTKTGTPAVVNPATGVKLKVAALNASPSTEHANSSYESQYTGDTVQFMAVLTKMI